jgi:cytochrome c6
MLNVRKPALLKSVINLLAVAGFVSLNALAGSGQTAKSPAANTYKTNCVACHGADGRGSAVGKSLQAPDFHSAALQQQPDAQLNAAITQGKGNMPAFAGRLSSDEISALVTYIRTFKKTK